MQIMNVGSTLIKGVLLLPLEKLKHHEETDPSNLKSLLHQLQTDRVLRRAIAVDFKTLVILDGHHRHRALEILGCRVIPCTLFNYESELIEVWSYPGRPRISKEDVISAALNGRLLPPKTSRHMVKVGDRYIHISELEAEVNVPIDELR